MLGPFQARAVLAANRISLAGLRSASRFSQQRGHHGQEAKEGSCQEKDREEKDREENDAAQKEKGSHFQTDGLSERAVRPRAALSRPLRVSPQVPG
jgi:hypothetical protein